MNEIADELDSGREFPLKIESMMRDREEKSKKNWTMKGGWLNPPQNTKCTVQWTGVAPKGGKPAPRDATVDIASVKKVRTLPCTQDKNRMICSLARRFALFAGH